MNEPKKVAALVTEYRRHSHADGIVGQVLEGFNYDEIAGQLRITVNHVGVLLNRARTFLRARLAAHQPATAAARRKE